MSNRNGYEPPSIDPARCDGCGDCVVIAPGIIRQSGKEPAVIIDPTGGPFKLLVKAASRCPTRAIKPGAPAEGLEKESKQIIALAERFNHA
jgi:pyruvate-ferredoxin/flavodoxin oxidoreductase